MKRFTHDADLRGMVVLRSLGFQLVPFKLHRFRKQRRLMPRPWITGFTKTITENGDAVSSTPTRASVPF
ncbi:hypothetical protein [Aeromonas salmonicida]|uniref:hypothetical protein n=1 Tax=Aeromonas salmonicida TaxID=645 RepID=UPI003BF7B633